ncbi:MAG: DUF2294 family protein [Pirellulales bacterium]|nr:DUF2294 family protein [Pirellulales bacterium]
MANQVASIASDFQRRRTGHAPESVAVVLSEDTLVITLHEALTPAEQAMARSPEGAARVQDFHRQLFADSQAEMCLEIKRITGRHVREAVVEIETATGAIVHAFATGAMVQVFLLAPATPSTPTERSETVVAADRAADDGMPPKVDGSVPTSGN